MMEWPLWKRGRSCGVRDGEAIAGLPATPKLKQCRTRNKDIFNSVKTKG
jgi:hypothetical protein